MIQISRAASLLLSLALMMLATLARAEPVTFAAQDGTKVFGTYSGTGDKSKPLVLLFHMAGSNKSEYAQVGPKLAQLGYNALAIDQRSGGAAFGGANETVKALGRTTGFEQALVDLDAAIAWVKPSGHTGKVIVVGSSYSAALVFLLAAKHPGEIAAIAAFSPAEYLSGGHDVRTAAASLRGVNVFVSSASDTGEANRAGAILALVPGQAKSQFVPKHAPHGASALGQAEVWEAFTRFLASVH